MKEEQQTKMEMKSFSFNPNRPPNEAVVSINHIVEKIFASLQIPELLVCRLVSRHFHSLAQKPLESLLTFTFSDQKLISTSKFGCNSSTRSRRKSLLKLSRQLQTGLNSLPVVKYSFIGTSLGDTVLQDFFSTNGRNIEHLVYTYHHQDMYSKPPQENQVMNQLTNLFVQAPNLQSLKINFGREASWVNSDEMLKLKTILEMYRDGKFSLVNDPKLQEIVGCCKMAWKIWLKKRVTHYLGDRKRHCCGT